MPPGPKFEKLGVQWAPKHKNGQEPRTQIQIQDDVVEVRWRRSSRFVLGPGREIILLRKAGRGYIRQRVVPTAVCRSGCGDVDPAHEVRSHVMLNNKEIGLVHFCI